tara:strand:- start:6 stop:551 length:546 start_codon:yes stop_codon:yes gene_type:complete
MAYDLKNVFYLDTHVDTGTSVGDASSQLDLSAYIDPIARGRQKGTGLAIYKVHMDVSHGSNNPVAVGESGVMRMSVLAGAGVGDNATGSGFTFGADTMDNTNALLVYGEDYYSPGLSGYAGKIWSKPSKEVPYVIVRDNVVLGISVDAAFASTAKVSIRLECAQVSLDQATLNQLLRTQTV